MYPTAALLVDPSCAMPVIVPLELTVNDVSVPTDVRLDVVIVGDSVVEFDKLAYELRLAVVAYELNAEVNDDDVTYELSVEVSEDCDTFPLRPLFSADVVAYGISAVVSAERVIAFAFTQAWVASFAPPLVVPL
jgi:hypothetical protein